MKYFWKIAAQNVSAGADLDYQPTSEKKIISIPNSASWLAKAGDKPIYKGGAFYQKAKDHEVLQEYTNQGKTEDELKIIALHLGHAVTGKKKVGNLIKELEKGLSQEVNEIETE